MAAPDPVSTFIQNPYSGGGGSSGDQSGAGGPTAGGLGLALQTINISACDAGTGSGGFNNTRAIYMLCTAGQAATVTKLGCLVATAGVTAGAGINGMALFTSSGTLMAATGDMTAAFGATGNAEGTLTASQSLTAKSSYYLAIVQSFTGTLAEFIGSALANNNFATINGNTITGYQVPVTTWASFTPASLTANAHWLYAYAR